MASYDPTWGRTKHLQRPSSATTSTSTAGSGYFDYFNGVGGIDGPAGDRERGGYYSFDVGSWHVVALNSSATDVPGGCDAGSPQQQWLARDLAAHPARCTLAMWHHPRYSSLGGGLTRTGRTVGHVRRGRRRRGPSGHHHFYERMAPIDGVREFIVGIGGGSVRNAGGGNHPSSRKRIETTFGVLTMRLGRGTYDWRFLSASADPATDCGIRLTCRVVRN